MRKGRRNKCTSGDKHAEKGVQTLVEREREKSLEREERLCRWVSEAAGLTSLPTTACSCSSCTPCTPCSCCLHCRSSCSCSWRHCQPGSMATEMPLLPSSSGGRD